MKKAKNVLLYTAFTLIVILCGIFGKDKWYNTLFSALAVVYLLLLTEGNSCGYFLCCIYAVGYMVISMSTGFYATAVFHGLFLFPISAYRFFVLSKNIVRAKIIKSLSLKAWVVSIFLGLTFSIGLYSFLREIGAAQPILDSVILSFSLLASVMMFVNYRDMWWFNLATSILYIVMWLTEFFSSGTGLSFVVMQFVVFVINIKGIVEWKKLKVSG